MISHRFNLYIDLGLAIAVCLGCFFVGTEIGLSVLSGRVPFYTGLVFVFLMFLVLAMMVEGIVNDLVQRLWE